MTDTALAREKVILVVEDELPLQQAIRIKLENSGLQVLTARTVSQATNYLEEVGAIDCIWLDHYLLGKESGLDFVANIKSATSPYNTIPIFVVSNSVGLDKVTSYIQLGVHKYYTKTEFKLTDIVNEIHTFLSENAPTEK